MLYVESEKPISNIEIFNQQGQLVTKASTKSVSVNELPSGLYIVKVRLLDERYIIQKLIK